MVALGMKQAKCCSECLQVKISVTRKKLEKKSIYQCNNAGKAQFDGNQSKNLFGAIKLKTAYFGY